MKCWTKLIKPPPESSKVFSMAKFMSSWILFDVAVLEDLWLALSLLVSLWKLNLPACRTFDYAAGKILILLSPIILGISTSSLPDFFFFKVFLLDVGLRASWASLTCLAFRLERIFPIKKRADELLGIARAQHPPTCSAKWCQRV